MAPYLVLQIQDITEQRLAEEALRKSEAPNRAVLETATDAIVTMAPDGSVVSFNPAAERTFGYRAEEMVGRPLRTLMPGRFRGAHEAGFRRYLGGGEARVVQHTWLTAKSWTVTRAVCGRPGKEQA